MLNVFRARSRQLGAMLIMAIGLLAALWFIVLGFASSSVDSLRTSSASLASERALWAAEAGLTRTLSELMKNPDLRPKDGYESLLHTPEEFRVEIFRDSSKAPLALPSGTVYVVSHGRDRGGAERRAAALVKLGSSGPGLLDFSVFTQTLSISGGSSIDSFDSKLGSNSRGDEANVATNSTTPGSIDIDGGAWINGTISVGPGGAVGPARPSQPTRSSSNVVWKNWSTWSLEESNLQRPLEYPPVQAPTPGSGTRSVGWQGATLQPGTYGHLEVSGGGKVVLGSGSYTFRSITVTGGGSLAFEGTDPATIFVTESLDLSNGTTSNTSQRPKNMLFMLADGVHAKIRGGTHAYMVIYGPGATIDMAGGNHLYGALVAKDLKITGGSHFHYDVDLRRDLPPALVGPGGSGGGMNLLSWQRF